MNESILASPTVFSKNDILYIINNLPIAVAVIDADRKLALANKMACKFVDKNENQLVGLINGAAFGCIHHEDASVGDGFHKECVKC